MSYVEALDHVVHSVISPQHALPINSPVFRALSPTCSADPLGLTCSSPLPPAAPRDRAAWLRARTRETARVAAYAQLHVACSQATR
jgi:hypothetical protein